MNEFDEILGKVDKEADPRGRYDLSRYFSGIIVDFQRTLGPASELYKKIDEVIWLSSLVGGEIKPSNNGHQTSAPREAMPDRVFEKLNELYDKIPPDVQIAMMARSCLINSNNFYSPENYNKVFRIEDYLHRLRVRLPQVSAA